MKIFLAVTAYDHKVYGECSEAILKNCISLMQHGHTVIPYYNNDLYIDRSRNLCAHLFLETDCDSIVFVDSDLSFDDDAILKLLNHDRDIVAGAYPYKKLVEEYPVTLWFDHQMNCKDETTGLVSCERVPTGLMRVNRQVFEKMQMGMQCDERGIYPFFKTGMVYPDDPNWYGEDAYFCKRWRSMGGKIWLEPRINFIHYGINGFSGNYHEYLMGRRIDQLDAVPSGIPGWMTEPELTKVRELSSHSESVVEVGSWKGRSTKEILESCDGPVYAVDHWNGSKHDASKMVCDLVDIYNEFIQNVGGYPNLVVCKGNSIDIADQFNGNKVDMVFIDAGHEYEECRADIEAWLPKCKKFMCGHDYGSFPGVTKAVDEKFGDAVRTKDSIWYVEVGNEQ
jgi:hypothetical protein